MIESYAANTHNGISRNYNEDRISIVLDLKKPGLTKQQIAAMGPQDPNRKISFFAIFDGHGGSGCAEFLRDNLHNFIAKQDSFPKDLEKSIKNGFKDAEDYFQKQN